MTDLEKIKAVFDEVGVPYTELEYNGVTYLEIQDNQNKDELINFEFDSKGKFDSVWSER